MARKRGRPPHPDILTPRQWEVLALLRDGLSNPQIGERLGISRRGARWHVSEILGKLGLSTRFDAAAWQPTPVPWWRTAFPALLAWPFKSLWWGSAAKATAAVGVAAAVAAFALPDGLGIFVTSPTSAGQDLSYVPAEPRDYSYVTSEEMVRMTDEPSVDVPGAWSPDCSRIVFASDRDSPTDEFDIYVMNADGTGVLNLTNSSRVDKRPAWSPDGTRIAFASVLDGKSDIYVMNEDGTNTTNLTQAPGRNGYPDWSPDGQQISFSGTRDGSLEIYVMKADGTGHVNLTDHPAVDHWGRWSPDGRRIVFASDRDGDWKSTSFRRPSEVHTQIYSMNADGSGVTRLTDSPTPDFAPHWSPDGLWISFTRVRDDGGDVYMMKPDGTEVTHVTKGRGGGWSTCQLQSK